MKQLVCEMCGNTDLIKQDGVFVCQSCGVKYSVEEAKKMMVEIKGSVKIDKSDDLTAFYELAKNAFLSQNWKELEEYSNKILEIHPSDPLVIYWKGLSAGWQSTVINNRINEAAIYFKQAYNNTKTDDPDIKNDIIISMRELCIANLSLVCNHYQDVPGFDNAKHINDAVLINNSTFETLKEIGIDIADDVRSEYKDIIFPVAVDAVNAVADEYSNAKVDGHVPEYLWNKYVEMTECFDILLNIIVLCTNLVENKIKMYEALIMYFQNIADDCQYAYGDGLRDGSSYYWSWTTVYSTDAYIDKVDEYHRRIKELKPEYIVPSKYTPKNRYPLIENAHGVPINGSSNAPSNSSNSNGCYVATCVYGSYDCPEVWTLRRYRDNQLSKTWYGRLFIHSYYAISPTIVKLFGKTDWFKNMWRNKLDSMVINLKELGYEDTPYEDQNW